MVTGWDYVFSKAIGLEVWIRCLNLICICAISTDARPKKGF